MKKALLILLSIPGLLSAQKKPGFEPAYFEKNLVLVGGVVYASKYECSNGEYRIFLNDLLAKNDTATYRQSECDTMQWLIPATFNVPFVHHYHDHEGYIEHPVVNIRHEGAKAYCRWLTEQYNNSPKRKFKKVVFRLPQAHEWVQAANNGKETDGMRRFAVAGSGGQLRTGEGVPLANFKIIPDELIYKDENDKYYISDNNKSVLVSASKQFTYFTLSTRTGYPPTNLGLLHMTGNVAEMISEPGHTKGGSWHSPGGYLYINGPDEYQGFHDGSPMIGFRVFMEVLEK